MKISYYHFPTIDSTNNFAKQNILQFDPSALTVISATTQTEGRGRYKRVWVSPEGNVCLTFVLFDDTLDPFFATQLASLAVDDMLHEYGVESVIKWPNDLVVKSKKIGGILTEKSEQALIIGIGLNVSLNSQDVAALEKSATSIYLETNALYSASSLIHKIVEKFHKRIHLRSSDDQLIWLERVSWMVDKSYSLTRDKTQKGTICSIKRNGELLFLHSSGEKERILTGDIHI